MGRPTSAERVVQVLSRLPTVGRWVHALLLVSAIGAAAVSAPTCKNGKPCPNIVLFILDDLGWNNVPWHDASLASKLPTSMRLVKEGVELDRHYAFLFCGPSRSSLQSGRFPHHVNQVNAPEAFETAGINRKMTTIPRKLKQAGYRTYQAGKWHVGVATPDHTPRGRGFDSSLTVFAGGADHYTQRQCQDLLCDGTDNGNVKAKLYDLWEDDGPAYEKQGTGYADDLFTDFIVKKLQDHPVAEPAFVYLALLDNHSPMQVPSVYRNMFPEGWRKDRRTYAGMSAHWDAALGKIEQVLKNRGMWENTLLVFTSDNGGAVYPSLTALEDQCGGGNNWPLYGGKASNWEGGVRVSSFITGGFLPANVRGTKQEGNIHIADWYATFCGLAGVDPADNVPGLPPIDSLDVWPLISGQQAVSPRVELPLSVDAPMGVPQIDGGLTMNVSAIIVGDFKLLTGKYLSSFRQAPEWPTRKSCCHSWCWVSQIRDCGTRQKPGCLFNIREDPSERNNLARSRPDLVAQLSARLAEHRKTIYNPQRADKINPEADRVWRDVYKGFIGPWKDIGPGKASGLNGTQDQIFS